MLSFNKMKEKYFTAVMHPSVAEEHEDVYISGDGREIVLEAMAITERVSKSRIKKVGSFLFNNLSAAGGNVDTPGLRYLYDQAKRDEDDLNLNR
jgi:hypothetical protein